MSEHPDRLMPLTPPHLHHSQYDSSADGLYDAHFGVNFTERERPRRPCFEMAFSMMKYDWMSGSNACSFLVCIVIFMPRVFHLNLKV